MAVFPAEVLAYAGHRLPLLASRVIKPPKNGAPGAAHKHSHSDSHNSGHGHGHDDHHNAAPQGPIGEATAVFEKSHAAANFEVCAATPI